MEAGVALGRSAYRYRCIQTVLVEESPGKRRRKLVQLQPCIGRCPGIINMLNGGWLKEELPPDCPGG